MKQPKIEYKCPHCGMIYKVGNSSANLTPVHFLAEFSDQRCPGSGQVPRGLADRRPLWKDEKK